MNCFQIIIFVTSETTNLCKEWGLELLWIAFKLLSLWRQKQPFWWKTLKEAVVNCFQIIIFVTSETTDILQRSEKIGCELLSNYYLCDVRNNFRPSGMRVKVVVNCFQIIIFVTSETTLRANILQIFSCELLSNYYLCDVRNNALKEITTSEQLWIAFKLLSLWRQKQLFLLGVLPHFVVNCFQIIIFVTSETTAPFFSIWSVCCELLSNYYLCDVRNNYLPNLIRVAKVVNCFQFIVFVTSETSTSFIRDAPPCCELLSNYYLCDVRNNIT